MTQFNKSDDDINFNKLRLSVMGPQALVTCFHLLFFPFSTPIHNFYPSINHILLYHSTWNLTKKISNLAENVSAWDRHEESNFWLSTDNGVF